ncbi:leucine-rich repeat domain-containing protein [Zobellia galactanivorans]|uniref:Leucine-rich repeat domain-containing protein n=1 Tax=Zobellia galactanivorans (strain DSM 12802 / CCUG 47099 / CIP 106680 / NCIMB 13871 / Dsij) TaxID=63186 RepID=G0L035_ZOBGA|nr:leucine-rich repeat domain-containing protein [Zobellia galactanivorans]CAZ97344.1 Hypothetical protein ZOBELLIA_3206 [Zobellia galactanivorans]
MRRILYSLLIVLSIISCKTGKTSLKKTLDFKKSIIDAQTVMGAIYSLTYCGKESETKLEYKDFEPIEKAIRYSLLDLSNYETEFKMNVIPMELNLTDKNRQSVSLICEELDSLVRITKNLVNKNSEQIAPEQIWIATTLTSMNPGSYYDGINRPDSTITLENHPLKKVIEIMKLQDISFSRVMYISDKSLLKMSELSPNIKFIDLSASGLTSEVLNSLNLDKLKALSSLKLYQNNIDTLPNKLTQIPNLKYLDLNKNRIRKMPDNLGLLKKLKYLDLRNNYLDVREKLRVRKALKDTKIRF